MHFFKKKFTSQLLKGYRIKASFLLIIDKHCASFFFVVPMFKMIVTTMQGNEIVKVNARGNGIEI